MSIIVLDEQYDEVIKSKYISVKTSYDFAISSLVPLADRLEQQRYTLRPQFYAKLEKDIMSGCIMPPLTLAIKGEYNGKDMTNYVNQKISEAFVLDGIQRLNTLKRIGKDRLDLTRPIYLNILICNSMDKLLYRMITLNNGQKPMSASHQVEILASNLYNFDELNLTMQTEKQRMKKRINSAFLKADVIKAYLAFISNSINIDNQKIIESKLDELITDQIIESDLTERSIEFSNVIDLINDCLEDVNLLKWFKVTNNLIGFSAGISKTYDMINAEPIAELARNINNFDEAFSFLDISKIRLGLSRRKSVQYFIENYGILKTLSANRLTDKISQVI